MTIAPTRPPAPARHRRAWRLQRRRHLPSALIDRYSTSQIRLNCHVLGRCAPCNVSIAKPMPFLYGSFQAACECGFQIIYELCAEHFPTFAEYALVRCKRGTILAAENHPALS